MKLLHRLEHRKFCKHTDKDHEIFVVGCLNTRIGSCNKPSWRTANNLTTDESAEIVSCYC